MVLLDRTFWYYWTVVHGTTGPFYYYSRNVLPAFSPQQVFVFWFRALLDRTFGSWYYWTVLLSDYSDSRNRDVLPAFSHQQECPFGGFSNDQHAVNLNGRGPLSFQVQVECQPEELHQQTGDYSR